MAETSDTQPTQALRNKLYTEAQAELRERHEEEFISLISARYAEHGLQYRRRLSDEQKAEKQIRDLLAAHPGLAEKFAQTEPTRQG